MNTVLPGFLDGARRMEKSVARVRLAIFGDTVTTDHISPAGAIKESSPAGNIDVARNSGSRFQRLREPARQ